MAATSADALSALEAQNADLCDAVMRFADQCNEARAVARELLEALIVVREWFDANGGDHLAVNRAIARAEAAGIRSKPDWAPETRHARDCLYVTSDGPAPCTCAAGIRSKP